TGAVRELRGYRDYALESAAQRIFAPRASCELLRGEQRVDPSRARLVGAGEHKHRVNGRLSRERRSRCRTKRRQLVRIKVTKQPYRRVGELRGRRIVDQFEIAKRPRRPIAEGCSERGLPCAHSPSDA